MHRLFPCACASSFLVAACGSASGADCNADPAPAAASIAGAESVDCGRVPVGGDRMAADVCAAEAFTAKKAFRVLYDLNGTDSKVISAVAGTPSGQVQTLLYDSDPSGGSGRHATLTRIECVGPHVETIAGHKKLTCTSDGASARLCQ